MDPEKRAFFLGVPVMALGIAILLFTLVMALTLVGNAGDYMRAQMGEPAGDPGRPPEASFVFQVENFTVTFQDTSMQGTSSIVSWSWDFGDGETSSDPNPTHVYSSEGTRMARLTVTDGDARSSQAGADVRVGPDAMDGGSSSTNPSGGGDGSFDLGAAFLPMAIALLTGLLYIVMFLVGGSITKAGWNLIRPRPETVKVRVKPKDVEVEAVAQQQMTAPEPPVPPAPPEEASDAVPNPP